MQGFTVLYMSDFMSQNRPWQLVLTTYIYGMLPLSVTQNQAIIVQYELACVSDCFVKEAIHLGERKLGFQPPRPHLWTIHVVTT
jgi:hypothetical protein